MKRLRTKDINHLFTTAELWQMVPEAELAARKTIGKANYLLYEIWGMHIEVCYPFDHRLARTVQVIDDLDRLALYVELDVNQLLASCD